MEFIFGLLCGLGISIFFPKTFAKVRQSALDFIKLAVGGCDD